MKRDFRRGTVERRLQRFLLVDGLAELSLGGFFLVQFLIHMLERGSMASPWATLLARIVSSVGFILFVRLGLPRVRAAHIYPRVGYAHYRGKQQQVLYAGGLVLVLSLLLVVIWLASLQGGQALPASAINHLLVMVLVAFCLVTGAYYNLKRFYAVGGGLVLLLPLSLLLPGWRLAFGYPMPLLGFAGMLVISGSFALWRLIKSTPLAEEEAYDAARPS